MYPARHLENLVGAEVELREHILAAFDDGREARVVDDDCVESLHVERALPRRGHREKVGLLLLSFEEWAQDADRLAAVIVRRVDARRAHADVLGGLLHTLARGDEDRDAALLLVDALEKLVVEEVADVLPQHFDLRGLLGVERVHLEDVGALEVLAVERRVHGCREPDETAPDALAEGEAELQFGRRLVDLVDDERVALQDVAVLEPAPRDAGGDDDDVPARRIGRGFALAVDHADAKVRGAEQLFRDGSDRERLAGSGAGHDAEAAAGAREFAHAGTEVLFEVRLDVESDGELDGLAGRARGRDDDDASRRRLSPDEGLVVGRKVLVSYFAHDEPRGEIRARHASGLLPVLSELPDKGQLLVLVLLPFLDVVIPEDNPAVGRPVVDGGAAVGRRRLLPGGDLLEPDATHARRRTIRLGHGVRALLLRLLRMSDPGRSGRESEREQYGAKFHL